MSHLSLIYSSPMTMLVFVIFVIAFMQNKNQSQSLKVVMIVLTVILAVIMFFYYRTKLSIAKALSKVEEIGEYEDGGMLDKSFILEDRMLAGSGFKVSEHSTAGIQKVSLEQKGRKCLLHITGSDGEFDADAIDLGEAQRFAAFIKRKNPAVILENVEPKGSGTLKELGAGVIIDSLSEEEQ